MMIVMKQNLTLGKKIHYRHKALTVIFPSDLDGVYFEEEEFEVEVEREAKVTTIAKFRDHSGFNRPVRSDFLLSIKCL